MRNTLARRESLRGGSESGVISVSAVIGIALLALVVYLLLAALNGDSDYYGSVPVPSDEAPVELPKGEVDIFLAVAGDPEKLSDITVPEDLTLAIAPVGGEEIRTDDRNGDTEETDDGVTKAIGAVSGPEEGTYLVTVSTDAASPALSITFGLSPVGAVKERFDGVVDWLNGPRGIAVLIGSRPAVPGSTFLEGGRSVTAARGAMIRDRGPTPMTDHGQTPQPGAPAPGWYHDDQGVQRWWDGAGWTDHVQTPEPAPRGARRSRRCRACPRRRTSRKCRGSPRHRASLRRGAGPATA